MIYGAARILVEFWRIPDAHIGYLAGGWLTMGMVLSSPMLVAGIALLAIAYQRNEPSGNRVSAGGGEAGAGSAVSASAGRGGARR